MRTFIPAKWEFSSPLDRSKSPFHRFVAENWGPTFAHCHTSCPPAQPTPLLLTVAALRFPGTSCPPIAPLPRIALAPSATGGASGDSSKSAHLLCHRRRFPAKTPSGQPISGPKRGRKPGPFLETSSLFPPPAALRLLYTVAALVIPASDKAEITAAASKAGRFFCLRQHFPAKNTVRPADFRPQKGPKTGAVPRNKLAFSATGGASLVST